MKSRLHRKTASGITTADGTTPVMLTLLTGGNSRDGAISRADKTQALPFTVMVTKASFVTTNRGSNRCIQLYSFICIAIELTAATGWRMPHI